MWPAQYRGFTFYFYLKFGLWCWHDPSIFWVMHITGLLTLAALKSILGLVLPMTQGYFGCCSLRDPRIVGSWRSPSATCALVLPAHRQAIQAPRMRLVCPTHKLGRPSARWPRPGAWPAGVVCPALGVRNPNGRASSLALGSCSYSLSTCPYQIVQGYFGSYF
jgi:hypothetical protein